MNPYFKISFFFFLQVNTNTALKPWSSMLTEKAVAHSHSDQ